MVMTTPPLCPHRSLTRGRWQVSCFGDKGAGDTGDDWEVRGRVDECYRWEEGNGIMVTVVTGSRRNRVLTALYA
jgi:hypothetical protein